MHRDRRRGLGAGSGRRAARVGVSRHVRVLETCRELMA